MGTVAFYTCGEASEGRPVSFHTERSDTSKPLMPTRRPITAKTLWAPTESWGVPDAQALELIDYPGKIGREGKRPRFRLSPRQQKALAYLLEIDQALRAVRGEPGPWLRRKLAPAPFAGRTPVDFMAEGGFDAMPEVLRVVARDALRAAAKKSYAWRLGGPVYARGRSRRSVS